MIFFVFPDNNLRRRLGGHPLRHFLCSVLILHGFFEAVATAQRLGQQRDIDGNGRFSAFPAIFQMRRTECARRRAGRGAFKKPISF